MLVVSLNLAKYQHAGTIILLKAPYCTSDKSEAKYDNLNNNIQPDGETVLLVRCDTFLDILINNFVLTFLTCHNLDWK